jgi:dTDP-4-dehydrorhamnose reductase
MTLFTDFHFTPIYVVDLVWRILVLLWQRQEGLFHLGGVDRVSKLDFGRRLAEEAGLPFTSVRQGSRLGVESPAPRAADISLCNRRFVQRTGCPGPGLVDGIKRFLADENVPLPMRFARIPPDLGADLFALLPAPTRTPARPESER